MEGLSLSEARTVRKLATLLRIADSLDRSHDQPVRALKVTPRPHELVLRLTSPKPLDLELWDVAHEAALFRRVFGRRLRWEVAA
jgi:exopolyphosphatase/guanosine-5'-triphosphate,3'-diphosphate pyrophosphatase